MKLKENYDNSFSKQIAFSITQLFNNIYFKKTTFIRCNEHQTSFAKPNSDGNCNVHRGGWSGQTQRRKLINVAYSLVLCPETSTLARGSLNTFQYQLVF